MKKYLFLLRIRLAFRFHLRRQRANSAGLPSNFPANDPRSVIKKMNM